MKSKMMMAASLILVLAVSASALLSAEGDRPRRGKGGGGMPEWAKKFDADGDGKLSEAERKEAGKARRAEMLKKFDKDGDNKLSEEEKAEMRKSFAARRGGKDGGKPAPGGPTDRRRGGPQRGLGMLVQFDKNKDLSIDAEEQKAAWDVQSKRMLSNDRAKKYLLKKYDPDNSTGSLSDAGKAKWKADFDKQIDMANELGKKMLKKFDGDGDGKLNKKEMAAFRKELASRRGPGGALTPEQFKKHWEKMPEQVKKQILKRFDKDDSGELNDAEIGEFLKARRARGGPGGRREGGPPKRGDGEGGPGKRRPKRERPKPEE